MVAFAYPILARTQITSTSMQVCHALPREDHQICTCHGDQLNPASNVGSLGFLQWATERQHCHPNLSDKNCLTIQLYWFAVVPMSSFSNVQCWMQPIIGKNFHPASSYPSNEMITMEAGCNKLTRFINPQRSQPRAEFASHAPRFRVLKPSHTALNPQPHSESSICHQIPEMSRVWQGNYSWLSPHTMFNNLR